MTKLDYSDIPHDWAICYQTDCPVAEQCLRRHAARLAPADLLCHNTILPAARSVAAPPAAEANSTGANTDNSTGANTASCCAFVADEPVVVFFGMVHLYDHVSPRDVRVVRSHVQTIFGPRSHYYRYREGRYPITPEQQAQVAEVFRQYGYTAELTFDRKEVRWYFPKVKK